MKLPVKIAFRYLFSKKMNLVNIISLISVFGVAGMSAALIVILSVFNGFDTLIQSMMNRFDPDIKITAEKGTSFLLDSLTFNKIKNVDNVKTAVSCVEETALFQYGHYQNVARMKGVGEDYAKICDIDSCTYIGEFLLEDTITGVPFAVVGSDIAGSLGINIGGFTPLKIYVPLRSEKVSIDPSSAFSQSGISPSGIFHIHQDFDSKYVIVPEKFARKALEYAPEEYSSIEILCYDYSKVSKTVKDLSELLGPGFEIKDRYRQQDMLYKIMKSEKLSIILMLSFIIVIASFNIIGALTMLIIDKKNDIKILSHLGADLKFIRRVFSSTGRLITLAGAFSGLVLGLLICWLQIKFKLLTFPGDGSFIIDAYPVEVRFEDTLVTLLIVTVIGFLASALPVKKIFV